METGFDAAAEENDMPQQQSATNEECDMPQLLQQSSEEDDMPRQQINTDEELLQQQDDEKDKMLRLLQQQNAYNERALIQLRQQLAESNKMLQLLQQQNASNDQEPSQLQQQVAAGDEMLQQLQQKNDDSDTLRQLREIAFCALRCPVRSITNRVNWHTIYTEGGAARNYFVRIKQCRTLEALKHLADAPPIDDSRVFKADYETIMCINQNLFVAIMMET